MVFKSNRSGKAAILSKRQLKQLVDYLPEKYSLLLEVMLWGAGRVTECSSIRVRNFNILDGTLVLEKASTKTKQSRIVTLHPDAVHKLKNWIIKNKLEGDDYIFFSQSNNTKCKIGTQHLQYSTIDQYFRKGFNWIGVKGASTHSFRRTQATYLLNAGFSLKEIMDITGHKNIATLQEYLDTDKKITHQKYKLLIEEVKL
tara:strand:+ start:344 stop:943 length:600 start_codon:yes stop_codon:yes gene_type:complete